MLRYLSLYARPVCVDVGGNDSWKGTAGHKCMTLHLIFIFVNFLFPFTITAAHKTKFPQYTRKPQL